MTTLPLPLTIQARKSPSTTREEWTSRFSVGRTFTYHVFNWQGPLRTVFHIDPVCRAMRQFPSYPQPITVGSSIRVCKWCQHDWFDQHYAHSRPWELHQ